MQHLLKLSMLGLMLITIPAVLASQEVCHLRGMEQSSASLVCETAPLREIIKSQIASGARKNPISARTPIPENRTVDFEYLGPKVEDPLRQTTIPRTQATVDIRFIADGMDEATAEVNPPDVNGAIGRSVYLQSVNRSWFQAFDRAGHALTDPFSLQDMWASVGLSSRGDPIVLYDEEADRWLLFSLKTLTSIIYAISSTDDPLGSYRIYSYDAPTAVDYPKIGISDSAYFLTVNALYDLDVVYFFNRQQIVQNDPNVLVQHVELPTKDYSKAVSAPVDRVGAKGWSNNLPITLRFKDDAWTEETDDSDEIQLWTYDINWENALESTSQFSSVITAPFDSDICVNSRYCIPQPNEKKLDGLEGFTMNKITRRTFKTHESLILNFSVVAAAEATGIRWVELRHEPGEPWTLYQEGTLGLGDDVHRWIGSMAINHLGDIMLAYAASGEDLYPSLRLTGRKADDPLGIMTVPEYELKAGSGAKDGILNRYGDYFSMNPDPISADFWFTGEYVGADNSWKTIVTSFSLSKDSTDLAVVDVLSPVSDSSLGVSESLEVLVKNNGLKPIDKFYISYSVDDMPAITEFVDGMVIPSDSSYVYTFSSTLDLSIPRDYRIEVWVSAVADRFLPNDTLVESVSKRWPLDLEVSGFNGLRGITCDTFTDFKCVFTNQGSLPVNTIEFHLWIDNNGPFRQFWNGVLLPGERRETPLFVGGLELGKSDVKLIAHRVNSRTDDNMVNDTSVAQIEVIDGYVASLAIAFDENPKQTSWYLEGGGKILYKGGPYDQQQANRVREFDFCLEHDSCYTFVILDSKGDGIATPRGYSIRNENNVQITSILQQDFGFEERNSFCPERCKVEGSLHVTDASGSDVPDGSIVIVPTAGIPPFLFSIDGGDMFQSEPAFHDLTPGTYHIVVKGAGDCVFTDSISVGFLSSTIEVNAESAIQVFPNPSHDGLFTIHVLEPSISKQSVEYKIVSSEGKPLVTGHIPRLNDGYRGMVSLYHYPAGTYYLLFNEEEINKMLRLIKTE